MGSRQLSDWLEDAAARRRARAALKWSVVLTLALYLIPFGALLAYPLLLLSTLFHELGHGIAAILTGGRFESLVMYADGSGVASHSGSGSAVTHAITAAGGLLGPAIVAAVAFASGRSRRGARAFLWLTAIGLVLALGLFVRNGFGIGFTAVVAGVLVWLAVRGNAASAQLGAVFLATQLALSVFSRADYLFTDVAATAVGNMPSDTAVIAQALGGTYWIWGLVCGLFSLAVLAAGVLWFLRAFREPARVLHR